MKRIGQIFRESLVNRVREGIDQNSSVFLVTYTQVPAPLIDSFRKKLGQVGAQVYVSKNSIAQIALKDFQYHQIAEKITGQMAFVWSKADCLDVAKVLVKFAKECENITIRGGLLDGKILEKDEIVRLSELPSKDILLAMLLSSLQSPLSRLAGALNAKTREMLSILKQLSEKKGGS